MIPKIIHYCWFGYSKKPKLVKDCIASWNFFLPEFEIIEWNETNCDLSHPFVKQAYKEKKWAFVSDYIRLKKLYEIGGIYLDTDMLILKSINNFLEDNCFFGAEDANHISAGIIGAKKNDNFILNCMNQYDLLSQDELSYTQITIPSIITRVFNLENGCFSFNNDVIVKNDVMVYPPDYFYPLPFENRKDNIRYLNYVKPNSVAVHLWSASWIEYSEFHYFRNKQYLLGFKKMLKVIVKQKMVRLKYYRKIASCLKESLKKDSQISN